MDWHIECDANMRTPVGIGDGDVGNTSEPRAHCQRQPKVSDHKVRGESFNLPQVVLDVSFENIKREHRPAARHRSQIGGTANALDLPDNQTHFRRDAGIIGASDESHGVDFGIKRAGQNAGTGNMSQRCRLAEKENSPSRPGRFTPPVCVRHGIRFVPLICIWNQDIDLSVHGHHEGSARWTPATGRSASPTQASTR
ncbi:MAG: hypothetical protein AW12_02929 [Candidatus Accumulibacter sp. BA-94]|nr:MAG: hypothetical protein AW12_02929 [Candidatus Accumulibacter sp. BA-94]